MRGRGWQWAQPKEAEEDGCASTSWGKGGHGGGDQPQEPEEDFAGACGAVRQLKAPDPEFPCDYCGKLYAYQSDIAKVEVAGDTIVMHRRSDAGRQIEAEDKTAQGESYTGMSVLKECCLYCFGDKVSSSIFRWLFYRITD